MLLSGFSHIFFDFLTNWGVPAFYPVDKRYIKICKEPPPFWD
jgi:membrane-bound metal-dependent hydrolase YbcI (DUF457 family)